MRKRRQIELFSLSFLDLISGALGAVIILYVAIPKSKAPSSPKDETAQIQMKNELSISKDKIYALEKELKETREKLVDKERAPTTEKKVEETSGGIDVDIGFKFKGNNVVFVIDTSYSMTEEDRMTQVKAGIKMLLTSLPGSFKIEIVQFPLGERAPFRSMWGDLKEFKGMNRHDAFDFIFALRPSGGTPTRDTLLHVMKNYEGITDIVLLTDGVPTYHNSNKRDDIYEILRLVRESNRTKIQINTIGVGTGILADQTSDQYKFLKLLSQENNGFFVGF